MGNKRLFRHTKAESIHHWQICTTRNVKKKNSPIGKRKMIPGGIMYLPKE